MPEYPTYDLLDPDCGEVKSSGEKFRILSRSAHKSDIPNPKDRDKLKVSYEFDNGNVHSNGSRSAVLMKSVSIK